MKETSRRRRTVTSSRKEISIVQLACTHEENTAEKNGYFVLKGNILGLASLYNEGNTEEKNNGYVVLKGNSHGSDRK
jgi:hypothetical protein